MIGSALISLMGGVLGAPSIRIEKTEVEFPSDSAVRLNVAAASEGIEIGSYGVRTVAEDALPPAGFRTRGEYAFLAASHEDGEYWYLFFDNKPGDENPAEGALGVTLDVSRWAAGEYRFLLFACNRPAPGAYVHDTRMLRVVVDDGRVVREKTCFLSELVVRFREFRVEPEQVESGEPFTIEAALEVKGVEGTHFQLTTPYTVAPGEVPPGLHYVEAEKKAYVTEREPHRMPDNGPHDSDPATGAFAMRVPTDGWRPGIYNLTFIAAADEAPNDVRDYRDFAVTVRPEQPQFEATLERDRFLKPGTHFGCFCRLADGSVLAGTHVTRDGGRTWKKLPRDRGIPMAHQLRDGTVLGLGMRTQPIEGREGLYTTTLFESDDAGQTISASTPCEVHVPRATKGIGHAPAAGPLFWRSIVEMPDGSLLAAMFGWFEGDESPVPGQPGSFRYRTFLVRSEDGGRRWEYHATVAYDPEIGTEGYCEPVVRLLPNGELICLLRTGGDNRPFHQDNPLCVTWSSDGAKTWEAPIRTGFEGVSPDLVVMADGTLACSTGRPGAWVLLSTDDGRTWGDPISVNAERYSGYTAICEVEPGVLLVGYGAQKWLDPETGERRDCLRTVRVRLRRLVSADEEQ